MIELCAVERVFLTSSRLPTNDYIHYQIMCHLLFAISDPFFKNVKKSDTCMSHIWTQSESMLFKLLRSNTQSNILKGISFIIIWKRKKSLFKPVQLESANKWKFCFQKLLETINQLPTFFFFYCRWDALGRDWIQGAKKRLHFRGADTEEDVSGTNRCSTACPHVLCDHPVQVYIKNPGCLYACLIAAMHFAP